MTGAASEASAWDLRWGSAPAPVPPSDHGHDLAHWPLRNSIPLGALEGAVPSARAHVRQLLWEWHRNELGQDVGLVVSELVSNAVRASAQLRPVVAPMLVWLGSDAHDLLAAVADASPQPPVRLNPDLIAERGRGLALIEAFSNRWGWHPATMHGLVKVVWAEWHLPPRAAPTARYRPTGLVP
jgi:anti-sigma regulatory factor (Ser/Thr protein kinase)